MLADLGSVLLVEGVAAEQLDAVRLVEAVAADLVAVLLVEAVVADFWAVLLV